MLNQSVPVVFGFSRSHCVAHMPYFFPTALVAGFLEESWAIFALCPPIGLSSTFQLLTVMWYWLSFSVVFFFFSFSFCGRSGLCGSTFFLVSPEGFVRLLSLVVTVTCPECSRKNPLIHIQPTAEPVIILHVSQNKTRQINEVHSS